MNRLRSDDPISQAIASSFLDFLQNSLVLANDADSESLAVAIECLAAIFNLDPAALRVPRQPQLLPEIFRLLLSQGFGQGGHSGQQHLNNAQGAPGPTSAPAFEQHGGDAFPGLQGVERNAAEAEGASQAPAEKSGSLEDIPSVRQISDAVTSESARQSALQSSTPLVRGEGPSTPQQKERLLNTTGADAQAERVADGAGKEGASTSGEAQVGEDTVMQEAERGEDPIETRKRVDAGKAKVEPQAGPALATASGRSSPEDLKKEADQLKKLGNEAMSAERFYEAIELYTQAISVVDTDAIYYANRAAAHTQLRQFDLAIKDCEQSIRLDPCYARAYSRLGLAYFEKGDYQTAIERGFQKALEIDPENAIVKQNLKSAQEKLARQSQRQQPEQPPPQPSASSGPPPTGHPQASPQVPQNVQGLMNMAANLFTPLTSMTNGGAAAPAQGGGVPHFPGFGAAQSPPSGSGQAPTGRPGRNIPEQGQPGFGVPGVGQPGNGAGQPASQPVFTVNVGGDQAGQQVQQLLTHMFQAFGAAAQRSGGQAGPSTRQSPS